MAANFMLMNKLHRDCKVRLDAVAKGDCGTYAARSDVPL
jgi:hypothetical protein